MRFAELVRGASIRGTPAVFSSSTALRLGRALGTSLRRRGALSAPVAVARAADGPELVVRDGLVRGLLLSGLDVLDLDKAESDLFTFALRAGHGGAPCAAGALIGTVGDNIGVMCFVGSRPLVGEDLVELARIADDGGFCVGAGRVLTADVRGAFQRAPPPRDDDDVRSDGAAP